MVLVAQSCLTLPPHGLWHTRLLYPWDSPGKNTGVVCYSLLQGIFPTRESNPGFLNCRQILYHLSYREDPSVVEVSPMNLYDLVMLNLFPIF